MKRLRFIFFLSFFSQFGISQSYIEKKITVESIGINKGLSQGMINCIRQDHIGFMWFGTMDGLNRYDGYKFQVFRNNPSDSNSISGNFITSIFEDSKRRLWVGTALSGLNLFIPETEQFIHFTINSQPALSNNTVLSIQEDKFGSIWIATQYGLNKLTVEDKTSKLFFSGSAEKAVKQLPPVRIKQIHLTGTNGEELFTNAGFEPNFLITKSGAIWVSASHLIFKLFPSQSGIEKMVQDDSIFTGLNKSKVVSGNVYTGDVYKITEDTTNGLLCFKGRDFFRILNTKNGKISCWNCAPLDVSTVRNQVVWDEGILWERTSTGLFCFDLLQKKMYQVRSYNAEADKLLGLPFSMYKDRSGIIWIGSSGFGLLKYNPRTQYFHNTSIGSVSWMSSTPAGNVLILRPDAQYFLKASSGQQTPFTPDSSFQKRIMALTNQAPDIAVQDKEATYWLNVMGITMVNLATKSVHVFEENRQVKFPYFLDNKDRLWYVCNQTLCLFNKVTNVVSYYPFPTAPVAASPYKFCQSIYQDANDIFWLGTTEGLFSFNEITRRWQHYKNIPGDSASLSTNIVFSLCDDPRYPGSYLWAGTNGGGLNRLCIRTGRFEHVGTKEGLTNMVVYGILTDEDKGLWISTNNGITCLKPQYNTDKGARKDRISEIRFRYYYEENGLQSNEFNRYAYCKTKDGILFFGGVNGYNYFDPRQVTGYTTMPNVVITDFKISNKPVLFAAQKRRDKINEVPLLLKPVFLTDAIEVPYSNNMVSFDFASLDYTAPEKNQYRYKMAGFDEEWIQSGNSHSATYTNLDPGTYTFTVMGSNSDGVWNERGASVQLTILAPWYMTWWFRTVLLLTMIALIYVLFRYRLQQKLKLFDIRNNIASDLHDEIGSTLSSVYIYSEVAQQAPDVTNPQTNTYLKQISADTGNMINALSDIVWTVNAKNDRFENIINRMRATAVELFEAKGYNLHLEFTGQLNTSQLVMVKRKNFYLFYKEVINNAAKYADGKNIWITLTYEKPNICLAVKDDGKGFDAEHKQTGNGFTNMQKRAGELKGNFKLISTPGAGTEVYLVFPA